MKKNWMCIAILFITFNCLGQIDEKTEYYVTKSNDTIVGKIKFKYHQLLMGNKVIDAEFKYKPEDGKMSEIPLEEIKSFRAKKIDHIIVDELTMCASNEERTEPFITLKNAILRIRIEGDIRLYSFFESTSSYENYYFEKEKNGELFHCMRIGYSASTKGFCNAFDKYLELISDKKSIYNKQKNTNRKKFIKYFDLIKEYNES